MFLQCRFPVKRLAMRTILEDDDARNGLNGGNRDNGGPSNVDNNSRDNADDNLAVRLVLARNTLIRYNDMTKRREISMSETKTEKGEHTATPTLETERDIFLSRRLQGEADIEAQKEWQTKGSIAERHGRAAFDRIVF